MQNYHCPRLQAEMKCTEVSYTHECCFCGRRFITKSGMKRHMAAYHRQHGLTDKEFEVAGWHKCSIRDTRVPMVSSTMGRIQESRQVGAAAVTAATGL